MNTKIKIIGIDSWNRCSKTIFWIGS